MTQTKNIQSGILKVTYAHFLYAFAFAASIVVFDASQLLPPEAVFDRWQYAAMLFVATTVVWYFTRTKGDNTKLAKWLIAGLVLTDILFASLLVYSDRGMASLGIALYAIPIVSSAVLLSRSAVLAVAALSTAAYIYAGVKYFVDFFNEGYKVQLYSTLGFYAATFFVVAILLIAVIQQKQK